MTLKEIQELIKLINRLELSEFKMTNGDVKIHIRTSHHTPPPAPPVNAYLAPSSAMPMAMPAPPPAPMASPAPAAGTGTTDRAAAAEPATEYLEIRSPMVGTFYRSSGPEKDAFVQVGDIVQVGDPVCIVEAMKLFNEIESDVTGKIVKVLIDNEQAVEYDQPMFLVDPSGV